MKIFQRVLHGILVVVAVFLIGLLAFAFAVGIAPGFLEDRVFLFLLSILPFVQLALVALGIWKRVRYSVLALSIVLCAGPLGYFVYDDLDRPAPPDFGPVLATDSEGYQMYCWLVKDGPHSRLKDIEVVSDPTKLFLHKKPDEKRAFLDANRESIGRAFEKDRIGQEWIERMAKLEKQGVVPTNLQGPILSFAAVRSVFDRRFAYSAWLASTNRGDEAAQLLEGALEACYTVEAQGASLVDQMLASVMRKKCHEGISFLLDTGGLDSESKKRIATVMSKATPIDVVFRNAFLGEAAQFRDVLDRMEKGLRETSIGGFGVPFTRFIQRFIYNPHLTERRCQKYYEEACRLAAKRNLEQLQQLSAEFEHELETRRLKNPVGKLAEAMAVPAISKVSKTIWEVEDARLDLLKQLDKP